MPIDLPSQELAEMATQFVRGEIKMPVICVRLGLKKSQKTNAAYKLLVGWRNSFALKKAMQAEKGSDEK